MIVAVMTGTSEEETRTATSQVDMEVEETTATGDGTVMEAEMAIGMETEVLLETVAGEGAEMTEIAT